MSYVALLHLVGWSLPAESTARLGEDVVVHVMKGSDVEQTYVRLCEEQRMDDGEPLAFGSFFLADAPVAFDGSPDCVIARLCNLAALTFDAPVGLVRLMHFGDGFRFDGFSEVVKDYGLASESLNQHARMSWDEQSIGTMRTLWGIDTSLRQDYSRNRRLINALDAFWIAWNGYYLDHVCIGVGIALEALFSPASRTEIAHQVAFNAAHLLGNDVEAKMEAYDSLKEFYGLRSSIVHGDLPNQDRLVDSVPAAFQLCSRALRTILLDEVLRETFVLEDRRRNMFRQWLFESG